MNSVVYRCVLAGAMLSYMPMFHGYTVYFHAGVVVAPTADITEKACAATLTSFTQGLVCTAGLPILSAQPDGRSYFVFSQFADVLVKPEAKNERLLIAQKVFELATVKKASEDKKEKAAAPAAVSIASDKKNPEVLLEIKIIALQAQETIAPETILKEGVSAFEKPFALPGKTDRCLVIVKRSSLLAAQDLFAKAVKAVAGTIDTGLIPNSQALLENRCKKYEY